MVWVHPESQPCNLLPGCSCSSCSLQRDWATQALCGDSPGYCFPLREAVRQTRRFPPVLINPVPPAHFQKVFVLVGGDKEKDSVRSLASLFPSVQRVSLAADARRQQETRWERDKSGARKKKSDRRRFLWLVVTCPVGKVTKREASQKNKID